MGAASVWYAQGADGSVGAEFMESRYGLEMTSLTVANINRAILKGQEKGVFELPKGPSGKVKLAKAAEDKEVRCRHLGLPSAAPDSCVPEENSTLSTLHRMKPPLARLPLASRPCTKPRQRESVRLLVRPLVQLPPSLRGQLRRCADSRFRGAFCLLCALLSLTSIYVYVYVASPYFSRASSLDRSPCARAPDTSQPRPKKPAPALKNSTNAKRGGATAAKATAAKAATKPAAKPTTKPATTRKAAPTAAARKKKVEKATAAAATKGKREGTARTRRGVAAK